MGVAAKANGTGRIDPTSCACLKVHSPECECGLVNWGIFWRVMQMLWREENVCNSAAVDWAGRSFSWRKMDP